MEKNRKNGKINGQIGKMIDWNMIGEESCVIHDFVHFGHFEC
jgi:hypothetical protein